MDSDSIEICIRAIYLDAIPSASKLLKLEGLRVLYPRKRPRHAGEIFCTYPRKLSWVIKMFLYAYREEIEKQDCRDLLQLIVEKTNLAIDLGFPQKDVMFVPSVAASEWYKQHFPEKQNNGEEAKDKEKVHNK